MYHGVAIEQDEARRARSDGLRLASQAALKDCFSVVRLGTRARPALMTRDVAPATTARTCIALNPGLRAFAGRDLLFAKLGIISMAALYR